jgi:hypothetical protein
MVEENREKFPRGPEGLLRRDGAPAGGQSAREAAHFLMILLERPEGVAPPPLGRGGPGGLAGRRFDVAAQSLDHAGGEPGLGSRKRG